MLIRLFALLAVVALLSFVGAPALAADDKADTHEGKVVKVEAGKLTMTDKDGKNEHSHAVPNDATITCEKWCRWHRCIGRPRPGRVSLSARALRTAEARA